MALTKISTAMISQSAAAVDLNVDAGTFYVDTTNNRVGVGGKTDPDTPLHVVGTVTATLFAGSGASLTNIPNSALTNSSITINSTATSLGGSITLGTDDVAEGSSNLYYTNARADARIAAADTDDLSEGSSNLYYTDARVDARVSGGSLGNITTTGYIRGPSSFTIDPAAHGDNTGTVVIAGNLQVDGTTTTINSTTMTVDDKNITLASGSANAAAASGAGFTVDIGSGTNPAITYDGTNDEWDFNKPLNVTGAIITSGNVSVGGSAYTTSADLNLLGDGLAIKNDKAGSSNNWSLIQNTDTGSASNLSFTTGLGVALTLNHNKSATFAGNIAVSGTVDGVDIAARDAVLTSTTTTAGAALPKAGGTMTGGLSIRGFNGPVLKLGSSGTSDPRIDFEDQNSTNLGAGIFLDQDADTLRILRTVSGSATDGIAINASGNVGIGTASPAQTLHVSSPGATSNGIRISNSEGSFETRVDQGEFYLYDVDDNRIPFLIDTAGNVGIGTSSPSAPLSLLDASLTTTGTGEGGLRVHRPNSASQYGYFDYSYNGGGVNIGSLYTGGTAASFGTFTFRQHSNGATQIPMFIDNAGNVGIGTTDPDTLLELRKDTASGSYGDYPTLSLRNDNAAGYSAIHFQEGSTQRARVEVGNNSGTPYMGLYTTGAASGITIKDGNVGIGDTNPDQKLVVKDGNIKLKSNADGNTGILSLYDAAGNQSGQVYPSAGDLRIWSPNDVLIVPTGDVGIGTTSPSRQMEIFKAGRAGAYRLKVKGDTGYTGIEIENTASSNTNLLFRNPSYTQELYMDVAGKFHVYNNSTHRFTVDQAGSVGIGTAAPYGRLELKGNGNSWATAPAIRMWDDLNNKGWLVGNVNNITAGDFYIRTLPSISGNPGATQREFTIKHATGNVGIGHSSPKSKLSIVGDGSLNTYSGTIGIENTATDKWASITLTDDIDTTSASSNYYLIGRGSTYANRYMSFHVPTAANYGSGSEPKFVFASTGSDILMSIEASTGTTYHKGNVSIGTATTGRLLNVGGSGQGAVVGIKGGNNNQLNIAHSSNSSYGLLLGNSNNSNNAGYHYSTSGNNTSVSMVNVNNDALHIGTNNAARLTIDHNGNTSIGTHAGATAPIVMHNAATTVSVRGPIASGYSGGTYAQGPRNTRDWFVYAGPTTNSGQYVHMKTNLWAGGSPAGNSEYTMSSFRYHSYYAYGGSTTPGGYIGWHNWSGGYPNLQLVNEGTLALVQNSYTSSDGYVVLVAKIGAGYAQFSIDWMQWAGYPFRERKVTAVTQSSSTTGAY